MKVSIVPAAAPRPETQEEILAAALAARDERDIPAEDNSWVIVDSDADRPAELAGLDGAELDELLAAAQVRPSGLSERAGLVGSSWLSEHAGLSGLSGPAGLVEPAGLGELAAAAPADYWERGAGRAGSRRRGSRAGRRVRRGRRAGQPGAWGSAGRVC